MIIYPHKIYEEKNNYISNEENKESEDKNNININAQKYKNIKIPELSPECKEYIKYNLFGVNNFKIKL